MQRSIRFLLTLALFLLPCLAASQNYMGGEVVILPFNTQDGHETKLAVPAVFSQDPAKTQLIGGTHQGSLRRDALRQDRYEEALRAVVYQPELEQRSTRAFLQPAREFYEGAPGAITAMEQFVEIAPRLVNKRYVKGGTWSGDLANHFKTAARDLNKTAQGKTHFSRLLTVAPAVIEGANLINDFLIYKALATDAAEVRLRSIKKALADSSRTAAPMDPALDDAIKAVEKELAGLRSDSAWRAIVDTVQRNESRLYEAGGSAISTVALKKLGASNPALLILTAELMAISSLADHHHAAQLACAAGTIAWRLEKAEGGSASGHKSAWLYAQYVYMDAMLSTGDNAMARISDALKPGKPYAELRNHYRDWKEKVLNAMQ